MIKEESRWGRRDGIWPSEGGNLGGRSISLLHLLPSFRPSFLPSSRVYDERKSFRDTGSETEEREERIGRERAHSFLDSLHSFQREGRWFVVQGWENGMLRIFAPLQLLGWKRKV